MTLAEELMGIRPYVALSPGRIVSHDDWGHIQVVGDIVRKGQKPMMVWRVKPEPKTAAEAVARKHFG